MNGLTFSITTDERDVEILRDKTSQYGDFIIKYNDETLDLLKRNLKRKDSIYILVKQNDEFVAFCSADTEWWEPNFFMIREIFVEPNFQKMSIGDNLMKRCVEYAKSKGAVGVVTETAFENIPMQKLCEKIGFKKWNNPGWKEGITYKLLF